MHPATRLRSPAAAAAADRRPGLDPRRLVGLMKAAIRRMDLDLTGRAVVTEAATGSYVVTPVLAALAGASRVDAVARDTAYGTLGQVCAATRELAELAGVKGAVTIVTELADADLASADIVTNSGSVRPIDAPAIRRLRPGAAVPLMYETWELRAGDVDLETCLEHGVKVAGTNERHPEVDVFGFHGIMAVKLLTDAGVAVYASRVLLLCDNAFRPYLEAGLTACGAEVEVREGLAGGPVDPRWDAVLVALQPCPWPVLDEADARTLGRQAPGAVVVQYWGDVDRDALREARVPVWPPAAPAPGHMGILPSAVGPEPIVRLQAAGLKVGELLLRPDEDRIGTDRDYMQRLPWT